jgi:hypothetical protein
LNPAPQRAGMGDLRAFERAGVTQTPQLQTRSWMDLVQQERARQSAAERTRLQAQTPRPAPTSTVMPDTYAAQLARIRETQSAARQGTIGKTNRTGAGRKAYVRPEAEGYTEPLGPGYPQTMGGYGASGSYYGEGPGYSYAPYSGNAAMQTGRGYNPSAQVPRWWHSRLSWRF